MLKTKLKLGRAELNHKIKYKQVINQMKSCWPQGPEQFTMKFEQLDQV
jgi:hypothetical protein